MCVTSAAQMAFFMACQTCLVEIKTVPDEAVGLFDGPLGGGLPAVVSTLCPVNSIYEVCTVHEIECRIYTCVDCSKVIVPLNSAIVGALNFGCVLTNLLHR